MVRGRVRTAGGSPTAEPAGQVAEQAADNPGRTMAGRHEGMGPGRCTETAADTFVGRSWDDNFELQGEQRAGFVEAGVAARVRDATAAVAAGNGAAADTVVGECADQRDRVLEREFEVRNVVAVDHNHMKAVPDGNPRGRVLHGLLCHCDHREGRRTGGNHSKKHLGELAEEPRVAGRSCRPWPA